MGDAAQGEPIQHEVFKRPFKIEPKIEEWDTPGNYRDCPGGDKLPDKIKVWRVQNTGKSSGGVVSRSYGYDDSPDAEVLTPGFNTAKESGAVGVGRHASFLQWGFSAPPSQMTDTGKKFFLNCVCYIHRFDGKKPLVTRQASPRMDVIRLAALINRIKNEEFFSSTFPPNLYKKYKGDPDGLVAFYQNDYELIYQGKVFFTDRELKSLGIRSNREVSTLDRLIGLLGGKEHEKARLLLDRYTTESFETPAEWRGWFDRNQERIYFSDVGGYKFRVIPEGYLN